MADRGLVERQLTIELARVLVAEIAPDELAAFGANAEPCLEAAQTSGRGEDEMLGFGLETVLPLATTGAMAIAVYSVQKIVDESTSAIAEKGSSALWDWAVGLFRRGRRAAPRGLAGKHLTPEQLTRVRESARQAAVRCGVPTARAGLLADSIVAQLAVAR